MARHWKIAIAVLCVLAIIGVATLPSLIRSVLRLRKAAVTEEQAQRELTQPVISTPTDTRVQAQLFWASANSPTTLEPTQIELPLSADPVQRAKQLIIALIAQAPSPAQRTLPADCELLQFYLLSDGTAIADFSEALSMETPSGILSEQMTVDSLVRTLAENVSAIHQLKIIIRGQEEDTLAGHLDLTGYFPVVPAAPPAPPAVISSTAPSTVPTTTATPAAAVGTPAAAVAPAAPASVAISPVAPAKPSQPSAPASATPPPKTP